MRFIEPDHGEITINSFPISQTNLAEWRKCVTWIPQKPFIFQETIAFNIHMGEEKADWQRLNQASIDANLDEFIRGLPDGYNTKLGEHGLGISGGQAQRLAIARAFYKDAPILLMDEPISRLDQQNEEIIQKSIAQLISTKTVFIIAHHLQTITRANQIIYLHNGELISCGNHEELIGKNEQYRRFVSGLSEVE
jgi:ATP-binding cassette subfamily C protein CydD